MLNCGIFIILDTNKITPYLHRYKYSITHIDFVRFQHPQFQIATVRLAALELREWRAPKAPPQNKSLTKNLVQYSYRRPYSPAAPNSSPAAVHKHNPSAKLLAIHTLGYTKDCSAACVKGPADSRSGLRIDGPGPRRRNPRDLLRARRDPFCRYWGRRRRDGGCRRRLFRFRPRRFRRLW